MKWACTDAVWLHEPANQRSIQPPHGIYVAGDVTNEIATKQPASIKQVIYLPEGINGPMTFRCFGMTR